MVFNEVKFGNSNLCVHSKRETCLKTDSKVFSEEISLKQDNLLSKLSSLPSHRTGRHFHGILKYVLFTQQDLERSNVLTPTLY